MVVVGIAVEGVTVDMTVGVVVVELAVEGEDEG